MLRRSKRNRTEVEDGELVCYEREAKGNSRYKFCIAANVFPKNLIIDQTELFAVGTFGSVLAGSFDGKPAAVKFVALDTFVSNDDCGSMNDKKDCLIFPTSKFQEEVQVAKFMADIDVGPSVFFSSIVALQDYSYVVKEGLTPLIAPKKVGVLVTERYGTSLASFAEDFPSKFRENFTQIFNNYLTLERKLNEQGFIHIDDHFGNFVIRPDTLEMRMIDAELKRIKKTQTLDSLREAQIEYWYQECDKYQVGI